MPNYYDVRVVSNSGHEYYTTVRADSTIEAESKVVDEWGGANAPAVYVTGIWLNRYGRPAHTWQQRYRIGKVS